MADMNPGRCKKCGGEIIWVPNPNGGWLRPMERFDARLETRDYDAFHGRQVYLALDGAISQIRPSSLLVWHECPPEPPEEEIPVLGDQLLVQDTGQILSARELDELVREKAIEMTAAQQEVDEREAQEIIDRRKEADRLRRTREEEQRRERQRQNAMRTQHPFTRVACPFCPADEGEPCRNQSISRHKDEIIYVRNAHQERQDWAYGSGVIQEEIVDTPQGRGLEAYIRPTRTLADSTLYAWLRLNANIWSDLRTTDPESDVNLFGNEVEASDEAGTGN